MSLNINFPQIPHIRHFKLRGDIAILIADVPLLDCDSKATPNRKRI